MNKININQISIFNIACVDYMNTLSFDSPQRKTYAQMHRKLLLYFCNEMTFLLASNHAREPLYDFPFQTGNNE